MTETMAAIGVENPGPYYRLLPALIARPVPGRGEVLIKVAAAGLNGADLSQRRGIYAMPPGASDVLGLEVSGTVAAIGEGAHTWRVGDAVCALVVDGGYAEYMVAPQEAVARVPAELESTEAAPLLCAGITTFNALRHSGAGISIAETNWDDSLASIEVAPPRNAGAPASTITGGRSLPRSL